MSTPQKRLELLDIEGFNEYLRLYLPNYIVGSREFSGAPFIEYKIPRVDFSKIITEYLGAYNPRYLDIIYRSWVGNAWVYGMTNTAVVLYMPITEAPVGLPVILTVESINKKNMIRLNKYLAKYMGLRDNQRLRLIGDRLWDFDHVHELSAYVAYLILKVRLVVDAVPGRYLITDSLPP